MYPQSIFLAKIRKYYKLTFLKAVKYCCILHGRVCIIKYLQILGTSTVLCDFVLYMVLISALGSLISHILVCFNFDPSVEIFVIRNICHLSLSFFFFRIIRFVCIHVHVVCLISGILMAFAAIATIM